MTARKAEPPVKTKNPQEEHWHKYIKSKISDEILQILNDDPILRVLLQWKLLDRYGLSPVTIAGLFKFRSWNAVYKALENPNYDRMWCADTGLFVYKPSRIKKLMRRIQIPNSVYSWPAHETYLHICPKREKQPFLYSGDEKKKIRLEEEYKSIKLATTAEMEFRTFSRVGFHSPLNISDWDSLKKAALAGDYRGKNKKTCSAGGTSTPITAPGPRAWRTT